MYLVGKADTSTKADTANDEHSQVLSKGTQNGADAEGSTTQNHDQLPATNPGHRASEETEKGTCSHQPQHQKNTKVHVIAYANLPGESAHWALALHLLVARDKQQIQKAGIGLTRQEEHRREGRKLLTGV